MQNRLPHRMRCLSPLARLAPAALPFFSVIAVMSSIGMAQASNPSQPAGSITSSTPGIENATVPAHEAAGEAKPHLPVLSSPHVPGGRGGYNTTPLRVI